jgi:hypothetical protein
MSDELRLVVSVDDTNIVDTSEDIEDVDAQMDAVVVKWKMTRKEIMTGLRITLNTISSMITSYREAMSLIGMNVDPFFSALIGMVVSTVSMLLALSTALAASGVGAAAAGVMLSIAIGLNIVTLGKLVADKILVTRQMNEIEQRMAGLAPVGQRGPIGGSF